MASIILNSNMNISIERFHSVYIRKIETFVSTHIDKKFHVN